VCAHRDIFPAGLLSGLLWLQGPVSRTLQLPIASALSLESRLSHLHVRPTFILSTDLPTTSAPQPLHEPSATLPALSTAYQHCTSTARSILEAMGLGRRATAAAALNTRAPALPMSSAVSRATLCSRPMHPRSAWLAGGRGENGKGGVDEWDGAAGGVPVAGMGTDEQVARRAALAAAAETRIALGLRNLPPSHGSEPLPEEGVV
jgi:hypothetical protein